MSVWALHRDGDCWPDSCPICPNECDACGDLWRDCTCPNDTDDTEDDE